MPVGNNKLLNAEPVSSLPPQMSQYLIKIQDAFNPVLLATQFHIHYILLSRFVFRLTFPTYNHTYHLTQIWLMNDFCFCCLSLCGNRLQHDTHYCKMMASMVEQRFNALNRCFLFLVLQTVAVHYVVEA